MSALAGLLDYQPRDPQEEADVARIRELIGFGRDPWLRSAPLHLTGSAVIVHPGTGQLLLRWHRRVRAWIQVGGHGDPGEDDPLQVALREATEETGLADLVPFPDSSLRHAVIVPVRAGQGEPAHEHADLRFVLSTGTPERIRPERPDAPLRWLTPDEAIDVIAEANLRHTIGRVRGLLGR